MELVMPVVMLLYFLGLALALQGSTAPSPSTLDGDSTMQVPTGPVGAPGLVFEPHVNFNITGSPALSPSPSVTHKVIGVPVAAPANERHNPISPVNDSPPQDRSVSPSSTPTPSIVEKRGGTPSAAPPISIPEAKPPMSHFPTKEPHIPFVFTPPSSIASEIDGMPAAAPHSESPEPQRAMDQSPITAPSSTFDTNSSVEVLPGPVGAPNLSFEPNVMFNNSGSPALSPSPSIVRKGVGTPVAAPANERRDPVPPVNDSPPQDPYISPTAAPIPSTVRKQEGVPTAATPIGIPGAIPPTNHSPTKEPHIPSAFTPPPSIVAERDGVPAAAPRNERPEPVPQPPPVDQSPTREPGSSSVPNPPPSIKWKRGAMPVAARPSKRPEPQWPADSSPMKEPDISPASTPPPSTNWNRDDIPVAAPSYRGLDPQQPANTSPIKAPSRSTWTLDSIPVAAPPSEKFEPQPPVNHNHSAGEAISPASNPPPSIGGRRHVMPGGAPVSTGFEPVHHMHHSRTKDSEVSPVPTPFPSIGQNRDVYHNAGSPNEHSKLLTPPNQPPTKEKPANERHHISASPPAIPIYKQHYRRNDSAAPASSQASVRQDPAISPIALPKTRRKHNAPVPLKRGSSATPSLSPSTSPTHDVSPSPSPSAEASSGHSEIPFRQPRGNPLGTLSRTPKPLPVVRGLPPPPPNADCSTTCTEPYTNSPPGSPCACVLPMQVGLRLGVDLYTFFPLVSEFAAEVSAGVYMKQSQVCIMGANAANQQLEKTIVLIDLVPLGEKFDGTTAFLTSERFWHKKVPIKASVFGNYEVLYVRYPGLPPSPPMAPSDVTIVDGGPYSGNNGRTNKPLGVDVQKGHQKDGLGGGVITIIVLSATVSVVLLSAVAWIFLFKKGGDVNHPAESPGALPSLTKSSAALGSLIGSGPGSASLSIESSIAPYTGSAKTLSTSDIEKATDNYNPSRILGEGGFGRVYSGVLEDGTRVAVKVLKRDDKQGSREFLAEIEMLSRLHHRNLVKLIGMCIEEGARCLVYELITNGSVESHLHGVDKESSPLDWAARMKIALGSARGLAYLHEDSSPRVIHRDFKASNILLEDDFTPKVSDFGLARTAMDEENRYISTRVMGTFGYVAPEYAMTGHLLVKSDVYSYGVVLLELLTGKKPVDMSQAPGQENLVAWARPLLTSEEGLEAILDPSLGPEIPFDSVTKVAAIASMCVQPEVSNRPFMGEVVQALKLVCNECEESYEVDSRNSECEELSIDLEASMSPSSEQLAKNLHRQFSHSTFDPGLEPEHGLSSSDHLSTSARLEAQEPGSFRRNSSSGPVTTRGSTQFWHRVRRLYGGSASEHSTMPKFWPGSG